MPIKVISTIKPNAVALGTNPSPFPSVEDIDVLGGFQVQATHVTRNGIPVSNRKLGMLVYTLSDGLFWQLTTYPGSGGDGDWSVASFGSDVTLGGDVTGPSATNTVVTLTGSGGIVTATAKLVTSSGRRLHVTPTTTSYPVVASDDVIAVGTIGAPITITLPASPTTGDIYLVKDANGNAAAHNISVAGNGHNIDGSGSPILMNTNYQTVQLIYTGTQWSIL